MAGKFKSQFRLTFQTRAEHINPPETSSHRSSDRDLRQPALYRPGACSHGSSRSAAETLPKVWRQAPRQGCSAHHSPGVACHKTLFDFVIDAIKYLFFFEN